jgi:hypothetical protein
VTPHTHTWTDRGECCIYLDVARRLVRCAARRCRAADCEAKSTPPLDYCAAHRELARRLVLR